MMDLKIRKKKLLNSENKGINFGGMTAYLGDFSMRYHDEKGLFQGSGTAVFV